MKGREVTKEKRKDGTCRSCLQEHSTQKPWRNSGTKKKKKFPVKAQTGGNGKHEVSLTVGSHFDSTPFLAAIDSTPLLAVLEQEKVALDNAGGCGHFSDVMNDRGHRSSTR